MSEILSWDERYKKNLAAYKSDMESALDESKAQYDKKAKTVTDIYEGKLQDTNQLYEDDLRENEVQKYINAREVAENNANLGLTDSGLNRTQQTAVQLSASNNAAKIERVRQSAVDELNRSLTEYLAELEDARFADEQTIKNSYTQMASEAATESYKADVDAYNEQIKSAQETATEKNSDYQDLLEEVADNKGNPDYCATLIANFGVRYELDTNDSQILTLLNRAEIKPNEFAHFGASGTIYSDYKEEDLNRNDDGNYLENYAPGRIKYNYKTDGVRHYKVKLVQHTKNLGGGIDNNDVVDIYYPDGTPVVTNLKLGDLKNKTTARNLTDWTAGKQDEDIGKILDTFLDLSEEDF